VWAGPSPAQTGLARSVFLCRFFRQNAIEKKAERVYGALNG